MNKVINVRAVSQALQKDPNYQYIGRPARGEDRLHHFGNPFSMLSYQSNGTSQDDVRESVILNFRRWLLGQDWASVEPQRRIWIIQQIKAGHLDGKVLGCFCAPKACHGDVLAYYIEHKDELPSE